MADRRSCRRETAHCASARPFEQIDNTYSSGARGFRFAELWSSPDGFPAPARGREPCALVARESASTFVRDVSSRFLPTAARMQTGVISPTVAAGFVPARDVTVARDPARVLWMIGGAAVGAVSGAIVGLLGVVMWSAVSVAPFPTFLGAPLVLGTGIPAVLGGVGVLIAASSADVSAEL